MELMIGAISKLPILVGAILIQVTDRFVKICMSDIILLMMELISFLPIKLKILTDIIVCLMIVRNVIMIITISVTRAINLTVQQLMV
jgi:hypothetical protein